MGGKKGAAGGATPKKNNNNDPLLRLTEDIHLVQEDVKSLVRRTNQIEELIREMNALRAENINLREENINQKKCISKLELKVDDLEQYSRADNLVITGIRVKEQSFAKVAAATDTSNHEAAAPQELDFVENQVLEFFTKKDIAIPKESISACHVLGGARKDGMKNIVIRFNSRKPKEAILRQWEKLSGTNVYVNEHLTPRNGRLAKIARMMKKEKRIQKTWTRNGRVYIKWQKKTSSENAPNPADDSIIIPSAQNTVTTLIQQDADFLECSITAEQLVKITDQLKPRQQTSRS